MRPLYLVGVVALLLSLLVLGCTARNDVDTSPQKGRVIVTLDDSTRTSMQGLSLDVDRVQVYSAATGWVTISQGPKTIDLSQGMGNLQGDIVIADGQVNAGSYDQIRLDVSDVKVTDEQGTHAAVVPAGPITLSTRINVERNGTSLVALDLKSSESVRMSQNNEYVVFPAFTVQVTANPTVQLTQGRAVVSGGRLMTTTSLWMGINGTMERSSTIGEDAIIVVEGGVIRLLDVPLNQTGRLVITLENNATTRSDDDVETVFVTLSSVEVHSDEEGWMMLDSSDREYDLFNLSVGQRIMIADEAINAGEYDQVRFRISDLSISDENGTRHDVELREQQFIMATPFSVESDAISVLTLGFASDDPVFVDEDGVYVLEPVVYLQAIEGAELVVDNETLDVEVTGGTPGSTIYIDLGMNASIGNENEDDDSANQSGDSDEVRDITVYAYDGRFEPDELTLEQGEEVRVTVHNKGENLHTFTVEEYAVHLEIPPQQTREVTFTVDEGAQDTEFICVPHEDIGMVGEINVVEDGEVDVDVGVNVSIDTNDDNESN